MFTGIIEDLGIVLDIKKEATNLHLTIQSKLAQELKIDQSVAHNGVCLTVVSIDESKYTVTAIKETLDKSNIGYLEIDDEVNLERCMKFGDRVDGHMVYGHVDTIGICKSVIEENGSWRYTINFPIEFKNLVVEKGSISLNGTSLTIFNVTATTFDIAIIPYTYEHTSIKKVLSEDKVNLEFDIFGKYVEKHFNKHT